MINLGFWKTRTKESLGRPAFVLAPMADVTDCAFRAVIAEQGMPDVMWTEFVSADGLIRATPEGKAKLMRDLLYNVRSKNRHGESISMDEHFSVDEHPIVAQLFSSNPEYMKQAAQLVAELGFDGIDINMGCPDKSIEKQGCGSAMIKNPKLAQEIIRAAKEGAALAATKMSKEEKTEPIPVSVKTRIGYNKNELETWLLALLEAEPAVITIHARTRKEMSKVPAQWEHIQRAVQIRDEFFINKKSNSATSAPSNILKNESKTLIYGNGDVTSIFDGYEKAIQTGADGVMLGRAIFGNPWLFKGIDTATLESLKSFVAYEPSVREKLYTTVKHTKLFEENLGDIKNFAIMKKHYKAYVNGFDGAKELRAELMEKAMCAADVEHIVETFLF